MDLKNFKDLLSIVRRLRDPKEGCPWDLKQTHKSLLKHLLEECYEFISAVEEDDPIKMEEELGDILLQVLLHGAIGQEDSKFTLESISKVLSEKLIRRHPHVFKDKKIASTPDEVIKNWNEIKKKEKEDNIKKSRIDNTYLSFPSLYSSYKIGKKTNNIGFDWSSPNEVVNIVESEWKEFKHELQVGKEANKEKIKEELGDLFFSLAQLSRHLGIEPEENLRAANKKFLNRFRKMENLMIKENINLEDLDQEEMDFYWERIKKYKDTK